MVGSRYRQACPACGVGPEYGTNPSTRLYRNIAVGIPYTKHDKDYREQCRLQLYQKNKQSNEIKYKSTKNNTTMLIGNSIRSSIKKNPMSWAKATGSKSDLSKQAGHYLLVVDLDEAYLFESPEMTLAKVVCNLRNRFSQNVDQTIELIRSVYNYKMGTNWSKEGIALTWELVKDFTPSLGLVDEDAISKKRMNDLEDDVVDLIACTLPGRRVLLDDLFEVFCQWNLDTDVNIYAFGKAVSRVTGMKSTSSKSKRYYSGFHLPKELKPSKKCKAKETAPDKSSKSKSDKKNLKAA